jgi:hypothetical protein
MGKCQQHRLCQLIVILRPGGGLETGFGFEWYSCRRCSKPFRSGCSKSWGCVKCSAASGPTSVTHTVQFSTAKQRPGWNAGYLKRRDLLFDALIVGQYKGENFMYKERSAFGFDEHKKRENPRQC